MSWSDDDAPMYRFDEPDLVTVGTEGEPGNRLFFLQVRAGTAEVSVKLEKQQVAALSEYLFELLSDLQETGPLPDRIDPHHPAEPAFAVVSIGVSYEQELDRILLLLEEVDSDLLDEDDGPAEPGASMRIRMTREQATALAARGSELVDAGRPPCPLCGYPLDPRGHVCPRTNGNRPPRL